MALPLTALGNTIHCGGFVCFWKEGQIQDFNLVIFFRHPYFHPYFFILHDSAQQFLLYVQLLVTCSFECVGGFRL